MGSEISTGIQKRQRYFLHHATFSTEALLEARSSLVILTCKADSRMRLLPETLCSQLAMLWSLCDSKIFPGCVKPHFWTWKRRLDFRRVLYLLRRVHLPKGPLNNHSPTFFIISSVFLNLIASSFPLLSIKLCVSPCLTSLTSVHLYVSFSNSYFPSSLSTLFNPAIS